MKIFALNKQKYGVLGVALLAVFIFGNLGITTSVLCRDKVILTNGEWAPYTSEHLPKFGLMSQIITEAYALMGIDVEYKFFDSWKRSYVLAQKGEFDGSIAWSPTPERSKLFFFCDTVILRKNVIFHLKTLDFDWQSYEDLARYRLSMTLAYFYGKEFDRAVQQGHFNTFLVYQDITSCINLLKGRTDLFVMEVEVGRSLLRNHFTQQEQALVTFHPKPIGEVPNTVFISKKIDKQRAYRLVNTLNQGLKKLRSSGRYKEIYSIHLPGAASKK